MPVSLRPPAPMTTRYFLDCTALLSIGGESTVSLTRSPPPPVQLVGGGLAQGIRRPDKTNRARGLLAQSRPSDDARSWVCETGVGGQALHTCFARYASPHRSLTAHKSGPLTFLARCVPHRCVKFPTDVVATQVVSCPLPIRFVHHADD